MRVEGVDKMTAIKSPSLFELLNQSVSGPKKGWDRLQEEPSAVFLIWRKAKVAIHFDRQKLITQTLVNVYRQSEVVHTKLDVVHGANKRTSSRLGVPHYALPGSTGTLDHLKTKRGTSE